MAVKIILGLAIELYPRTEDEKAEVTSKRGTGKDKFEALLEIRQLAGELLCEHCRYSTMTRVEVSIERAQFARTEADRLEAFGLRDAAKAELEGRVDFMPTD